MSVKTEDRLRHLRVPVSQVAEKPSGKQPYEAFRICKEAQRHLELRLRFPDPAECPLNAMITNIRAEWRFGMAITLIYGKSMMVYIKGERLQALLGPLKEWKIEHITEFDPESHLAPADDTAPFIKSIEIVNEHTESPPPLSQRH